MYSLITLLLPTIQFRDLISPHRKVRLKQRIIPAIVPGMNPPERTVILTGKGLLHDYPPGFLDAGLPRQHLCMG